MAYAKLLQRCCAAWSGQLCVNPVEVLRSKTDKGITGLCIFLWLVDIGRNRLANQAGVTGGKVKNYQGFALISGLIPAF
jgi:hypothetical protein